MATNRSKRPGFSLMMVTAVVAVAAVLGLAILTSNTLQVQASASQDRVVQADALAESAVNVGLYYLQNLNDATKCPMPALTVNGSAYTETNKSVGASVAGTYDLSVTRIAANQYRIVGTGKATTDSGTVQRTLTAVANVNYYTYGASVTNVPAANTWTIPANTAINGDVYASCQVINNGTVTGTIYTTSGGGTGVTGAIKSITAAIGVPVVPSTLTVNHYTTYTYNGMIYTAGTLLLPPAAGTTLNPTPTNPAGVYVYVGTLDLNGNVTVNGTLVVRGTLRAKSSGNVINPQSGFPAAVIDGNISFNANNSVLAANGLTYLGGVVNRTLGWTGCSLGVNGGLLLAGPAPTIDSNVVVQVNFDNKKTAVSTLADPTKTAPASVTIVSWKNQ
jgi:hypothetical protein